MLRDVHILNLMDSAIDLWELQITSDCSVSDVSGWIMFSVIGSVYIHIHDGMKDIFPPAKTQ